MASPYGIHELPYTAEQIQTAIGNNLNRNFNQSIPVPVIAGDTPVVIDYTYVRLTWASTSWMSLGKSITIPATGNYRLKWDIYYTYTSSTLNSQLRKNGTAIGTAQTLTGTTAGIGANYILDIDCVAGDVIEIWTNSPATGSSRYVINNTLMACINGSIGFAE